VKYQKHRDRAKLTVEKVLEIKSRFDAGESQRQLGFAFGVSQTTIHQIIRGYTWCDVESGPHDAMIRDLRLEPFMTQAVQLAIKSSRDDDQELLDLFR
jgi:DNA-binding XRE family transcriptional regulator